MKREFDNVSSILMITVITNKSTSLELLQTIQCLLIDFEILVLNP